METGVGEALECDVGSPDAPRKSCAVRFTVERHFADFMTEIPIRISPQAKVLPANTLRFYIYFPRPGEAHFDRDQLWLLNEEEHVVQDPFLTSFRRSCGRLMGDA